MLIGLLKRWVLGLNWDEKDVLLRPGNVEPGNSFLAVLSFLLQINLQFPRKVKFLGILKVRNLVVIGTWKLISSSS
jgi:hypothetical protein